MRTLQTGDTEFTSLGQWLREMSVYNLMRQMRVFKLYLRRKMIRIWRNAAHARAFARVRERLDANLFFAKPIFLTLIMEAKRHVYDIYKCSNLSLAAPGPAWRQATPGSTKWKLVDNDGDGDQHFSCALEPQLA
jgi:hypothetical protein